MNFWEAASHLAPAALLFLAVALFVAFAFEFINGFHDTANAVATVIYTRALDPTPAVLFSGVMNFLGALLTVVVGSAAVAFSIVNLLPVDVLIDGSSGEALVMVMALLLAGVMWNLGTWYVGLPVSSSHTLIGSILGVGMASSLLAGRGFAGVNWSKAGDVGLALLLSPLIGFVFAGALFLLMKRLVKEPRLYRPPEGEARPPGWIRGVLIATCGAVSFAHGSNDGQKGMGLILLVLIGFLPAHYAVNIYRPELADEVWASAEAIREVMEKEKGDLPPSMKEDLATIARELAGKSTFADVPDEKRWLVRQSIYRFRKRLAAADLSPEARAAIAPHLKVLGQSIEFVPLWVVVGTAVALGVGTTVGYKRIVITVAEKIGTSHLTYGQGAAAQAVAAGTILAADVLHMPVSTTQILSSGVAGTMVANGAGVQPVTIRKIVLAWVMTLPVCMLLGGLLFAAGRLMLG